jgi:SAM-dependent methyltransferase
MSRLVDWIIDNHFGDHPYRTFENAVRALVQPEHTLLDAGCGRTAPILSRFRGKARRLIGVDLVDFTTAADDLELHACDLAKMPVADASVDVMMARSVMEHVTDPEAVYREAYRVLKPGGHFVFLTANLWDYASIIAKVIPNRFHPWIVAKTEGRAEIDTFPVAYRTNTHRSVRKWAAQSGLEVVDFRYLGQYPAYLQFSDVLFVLGTGYEKVISRIGALNWLQGWIFATLRKPGAQGLRPRK